MNPPHEGPEADGSLQTRFQKVVGGTVLYLQARHRLFLIEAREASDYLGKRLLLAIVALVFLAFGYALLLAGAIIVIDHFTKIPWWFVCLLLAPGHLLAGYFFFRISKRPPPEPLFKETLNELEKDREWLSNPTKPWW